MNAKTKRALKQLRAFEGGGKIKFYFEGLKPSKLGLKEKVRVSLVEKLGTGANNANFLVVANGKKFIFRLNMLLFERNKTRDEFNNLKLIEKARIAPRAWILDDARKVFDSDFIVLDYIEGKTLNNIKYDLSEELVRKIARLFLGFHLMPIKGNLLKLPRDEVNYEALLNHIKKRYDSVSKMVSDKEFLGFIKKGYNNLKAKSLAKKIVHPIVLTHGDIAEQNIVLYKGKLGLVDFEGVSITDPAADIAYTFTQFGKKEFGEKQREIFLNEYLKHRKDETLRERVKVFMPMKNFGDLLWAIEQALRIKKGLMHKSYVEKNTLNGAISYAQVVFGRCIRDGTIDKRYRNFDLRRVI